MNVDGGPTKTEILKARRNPKTAHYWQLSFGKRGTEEFYNIKKIRTVWWTYPTKRNMYP